MIYRLHYAKLTNEFIELEKDSFKNIMIPCMASEFQKISRDSIEVYTSDELGGMDFPEFYYDDSVPLFAENIYAVMSENGVDNLFVKEVKVTDSLQELSKDYVIALPPRINVIGDDNKINHHKIGNYKIFKTNDYGDNNIYITEELKSVFDNLKPIGMEIIDVL